MWNSCLVSTPLQQPCHHTGVQLLCLYVPDRTMVSILHVQEPHTRRGHLYLCQPVPCSIYKHMVFFPLVTRQHYNFPCHQLHVHEADHGRDLRHCLEHPQLRLVANSGKPAPRTWNTVYYVTLAVLGGSHVVKPQFTSP